MVSTGEHGIKFTAPYPPLQRVFDGPSVARKVKTILTVLSLTFEICRLS